MAALIAVLVVTGLVVNGLVATEPRMVGANLEKEEVAKLPPTSSAPETDLRGPITLSSLSAGTGSAAALVALDGGLIASGGHDGTVQVWDPAVPGTTLSTYRGHHDAVRSLIQLENGLIASGSNDGTVQIWDPAIPEPTMDLIYRNHDGAISALLELDDDRIASASYDGAVEIWDPADPETTIASYEGHTREVVSLTSLADGSIASASFDNTVQIWDPMAPATTTATYTGHTEWVWSVIQLENGLIASGSDEGVAHVWDPADPATTIGIYTGGRTMPQVGHGDVVFALVQLDDGSVASSYYGGTVEIWDPADIDVTIATHGHDSNQVRSVAQVDSGLMVSAGETIDIWDPSDPAITIATYAGHELPIASSTQLADGRIATVAAGDVQLWDLDRPSPTGGNNTGRTGVTSLIELDGGLIATSNRSGEIEVWDPRQPYVTIGAHTHAGGVASMAQTSDGHIVSASSPTVEIWSPNGSSDTIATYAGHLGLVTSIAPLSSGLVASASSDGSVHVWDPASPEAAVATAEVSNTLLWTLMQTDSGLLVAGDTDGVVYLLDPTDLSVAASYLGHTDGILSTTQLDNKRIASASRDGTIQIWDPEQPGLTLGTYREHSLPTSVTQLADGRILSGGRDGARIWVSEGGGSTPAAPIEGAGDDPRIAPPSTAFPSEELLVIPDEVGDANIDESRGWRGQDLTEIQIGVVDDELVVRAAFEPSRFEPGVSIAAISIDLDTNPRTGCSAFTSENRSDTTMGTDYVLTMGNGDSTTLKITRISELCDEFTRSEVIAVSPLDSGYELRIPMDQIGIQSDFRFRASSSQRIDDTRQSTISDRVPDFSSPPVVVPTG